MNGLKNALEELEAIAAGHRRDFADRLDAVICPPATLLAEACKIAAGRVEIGAQDCHTAASGAHTGDISAPMIANAGAKWVIVGHSERRADHGETDALVRAKAEAAIAAGLTPIICIGETLAERQSGETLTILARQLAGSLPDASAAVIAYEPVWAIGTGVTPTAADVASAHDFIRDRVVERYGEAGSAIRLLYGGSVKPGNAAELLSAANVDGALVGGASLKASDFLGICAANAG